MYRRNAAAHGDIVMTPAHVPLCAMPRIDKASRTIILRFWNINCSAQCDWSPFYRQILWRLQVWLLFERPVMRRLLIAFLNFSSNIIMWCIALILCQFCLNSSHFIIWQYIWRLGTEIFFWISPSLQIFSPPFHPSFPNGAGFCSHSGKIAEVWNWPYLHIAPRAVSGTQ